MANISFNFKVYGDDAINREIMGVYERVGDWRPAFRLMRQSFFDMEQKQFDTQGSAGPHGKWAELSAARVLAKARHKPKLRPEILQATGALMRSLTILGAKGGRSRLAPKSMYVGSAVPYGKYHQKAQGNRIVRRPIDFPEQTKVEWIKIMQAHLALHLPR